MLATVNPSEWSLLVKLCYRTTISQYRIQGIMKRNICLLVHCTFWRIKVLCYPILTYLGGRTIHVVFHISYNLKIILLHLQPYPGTKTQWIFRIIFSEMFILSSIDFLLCNIIAFLCVMSTYRANQSMSSLGSIHCGVGSNIIVSFRHYMPIQISYIRIETGSQYYKVISSIDRCSTHNLCSEMAYLRTL